MSTRRLSQPNLNERLICGLRATGRLHLGNYFGAIRDFVQATNTAQTPAFFIIADLHALPSTTTPKALSALVPELVLDLVASGVDPERVAIYTQSSVPETSELAVLLASVAYVPELERAPSFAERARDLSVREPPTVGQLTYPVLMAADILGPRAHKVAVGEDQYPHLEITRDIGRRFNRKFTPEGELALFPEPRAIAPEPVRIPGLDGSGKMGKSAGNTLGLFAPPEAYRERLQSSPTHVARPDPNQPGIPDRCDLFMVHQLAASPSANTTSQPAAVQEIEQGCKQGTLSCQACKDELHRRLENELIPLRTKRESIANASDTVKEILFQGAVSAQKVIRETRNIAQDRVGIVRYNRNS